MRNISNKFFKPSRTDFVSVQINGDLANLAPLSSQSFIYKVHKQLRCINENAYEPEIVAIGPYHHGKQNLNMMEEHKLRYLQQLLDRKGEINADRYILLLRSLQLDARRCYAEPINYTDDEFVKMLLLDGCFIIEVFRKFERRFLRRENDPIFRMYWILNSLQRDLMLFENQLPLDILFKLFDLIEVPGEHDRFKDLALDFFKDLLQGSGNQTYDSANSALNKHLLGLIHNNWLPSSRQATNHDHPCTTLQVIPSATELLRSGVKIMKAQEGSLFDIKFLNGVLFIPPLRIEDRTETFLRNLVAYEEYFNIQLRYVTDYVKFVDYLVNSVDDVETLRNCGIINNWLGDEVVVSDIFNKITNAVIGPSSIFIYADIFDKLNQHCGKRKNKWFASFKREYYLDSPWKVISVLAAVILLLLTVTQTVFTIFASS